MATSRIRSFFAAFLSTVLLVLLGTTVLGSASAQAQQSGSVRAASQLEEIVVTARRREENLLELPLSIQAITADQMETLGIGNVEDITDFVPNATLMVTGRSNLGSVIVRGIGGGSPEPGDVYGSAMYLDGHYMPSRQNGFMTTSDIERIEVLRGPQGTLFGKNVTGGLVNIITVKPGPEFDASVTLRAADHGQQDIRGMINFPISDNVFARLSASSEQMDGYYFNQHLNIDAGATDLQAYKAALRYTPSNWTLDFSLSQQTHNDDNRAYQCNPEDGTAGRIGGLNNNGFPGYSDALKAACAADSARGLYVTSSDMVSYSDNEVNTAFAVAQWNSPGAVGSFDGATFKVQGSWQDSEYFHLLDRDHSFYPVGYQGQSGFAPGCVGRECGQRATTRSLEIVFEADVNDRLTFTVGANLFNELNKIGDGECRRRFLESGAGDIDPVNPTVPTPGGGVNPNPASGDINSGVDCNDGQSGLLVAPNLGSSNPFLIQVRGENESIGIFGHLTYALSDNWDLDAGLRWTDDDREYWNFENGVQGCDPGNDPAQSSLGVIAHEPNLVCTFSYAPTFETANIAGFNNKFSNSWSEVTPMVSLTRNLQGGDTLQSGMIYFLYSEGFLTGGFNTELNQNLPALQGFGFNSFDPERVSNYEVGFKGTLLDNRLRIMADVFYMDYQDKQENIELPNEGGVFGPDEGSPLDIKTNVAKADIKGIELDLRANPWDGGFLSVNLGWLDSTYASYQYPDPLDPGTIVDASGDTLQNRIPEWTLTVGVDHTFTLPNGATITPHISLYTQEKYDYEARVVGQPDSPFCSQDSYVKVNVRATYEMPSSNWRASLFGNNVTDEDILGSCGQSYGVWSYWHQRPAWWGLEFTKDWGAN